MKRIITYVDGFNLYHGAKELMRHSNINESWKWIDHVALSKKLIPDGEISVVKYYTAKVSERENDRAFVQRQQVYLRALSSQSEVQIILGQFMHRKKRVPIATKLNSLQFRLIRLIGLDIRRHQDGNYSIPVWKTEEKATDVNLGVHLVADAFLDNFDEALVISNDSDLREPIRLVVNDLGKSVIVANPRGHKPTAASLVAAATETRQIRASAVTNSQFPDVLRDQHGQFEKPHGW